MRIVYPADFELLSIKILCLTAVGNDPGIMAGSPPAEFYGFSSGSRSRRTVAEPVSLVLVVATLAIGRTDSDQL